MLAGIGTDLVRISRIEKSLENPAFLNHVYGEAEKKLLESRKGSAKLQTAAANYAAKEAFGKALGTGILREFSLAEVQALRDENGAPYYAFSGRAAQIMEKRKLHALLSLTHEGDFAGAFAVLEAEKKE